LFPVNTHHLIGTRQRHVDIGQIVPTGLCADRLKHAIPQDPRHNIVAHLTEMEAVTGEKSQVRLAVAL
jgi:hypothetical protein